MAIRDLLGRGGDGRGAENSACRSPAFARKARAGGEDPLCREAFRSTRAHAQEVASFTMAYAGAIEGAAASEASFHFQKLTIQLPMASADVFDANGNLHGGPRAHGLLVHELTHYLQGVSTVLGQRIILNWAAVAIGAAKSLHGIEPLPVPLNSPKAQKTAGIRRAVAMLAEYLGEVAALVGASCPLREAAEASRYDEFSCYEYSFPHPRDNIPTRATALRLTSTAGEPYGVPLLGDALTEGMAQAAEWIASGVEATDETLGKRPNDPAPRPGAQDIYYTAVIRAVRARMPTWEPRLTTLVLCDAALCSRFPGETLAYLLERLSAKAPPPDLEGYRVVRRRLDELRVMRDSRDFILATLDEAEMGIPADGVALAPALRTLIRLFREAWSIRQKDPAVMISDSFDQGFILGKAAAFGAPPFVFSDKTHLVTMTHDEDLTRACHALRGCFEILIGLCIDGLAKPCSILHSKLCSHRKTENCRKRLLSVPINDGKLCFVGFAAMALGLHSRELNYV